MSERQDIGREAESLAECYLQEQGLEPEARNQHSRRGEIDLIMRDGAALVFIEVRYRRSRGFGHPAETVDARKQHKLRLAAEHYLQRNPHRGPCRFDVVTVEPGAQTPEIGWIRDAF